MASGAWKMINDFAYMNTLKSNGYKQIKKKIALNESTIPNEDKKIKL